MKLGKLIATTPGNWDYYQTFYEDNSDKIFIAYVMYFQEICNRFPKTVLFISEALIHRGKEYM